MFKKLKRLSQSQKEMVTTLDIERIGMVINSDMLVQVQWKRGKLIDSTQTLKLMHKGV